MPRFTMARVRAGALALGTWLRRRAAPRPDSAPDQVPDSARAESRFRDLLEGLSVVVWEADADTLRCTYVSPQCESLLGMSAAECTATDLWRRILHPDDYGRVMAERADAVARGQDHRLEYRVLRAGGDVLWVRDHARVITNADGEPERLRGVMIDITQTRAADEAQHESGRRYQTLFQRVPVGLYRATPAGRLIDVNPALARLLGFDSREELLADDAADLHVNEDSRRQLRTLMQNAAGVVEVDRSHLRRDGSLIWVRDTVRAVRDPSGAVLYHEGALQDITERVRAEEALRESESYFRSITENASEGVVIVSRDGLAVYQSPAVERMLGYPADPSRRVDDLELVHPDDRAVVASAYADLLARAGAARSIEFRCRHRDGGWQVLHAVGTNMLDDPAINGIVVHMIDATNHWELQQQLREVHKMQAVGRLAGGIAHDFNNLLTSIQGHADLLAADAGDQERARSDLAEIRRAVDRATRLTRQLLVFSRRQLVSPRPVALERLVDRLQPRLRRLLENHVTTEYRLSPHCWIHADPAQLEQLVTNLMVNASEASASHIGVVVEPRVIGEDDAGTAPGLRPGQYVALTVQDDGHGIPADMLPHIFEPFFTTKEVGKGTGLGLATVYGIVEEAGGRAFAESSPGGGTRITVFLPRVPRPAEESAEESAETTPDEPAEADVRTAAVPEKRPRGHERILLAEDESAVRSLTERVLRRDGYDVLTAENGVDALRVAESAGRNIDLLITDVVMPEMNGVELARRMMDARRELRVLFISGYSTEALPDTDAAGRPLVLLEKPFSPAALSELVRRILDDEREPLLSGSG